MRATEALKKLKAIDNDDYVTVRQEITHFHGKNKRQYRVYTNTRGWSIDCDSYEEALKNIKEKGVDKL